MSEGDLHSMQEKVRQIFQELVADRSQRLDGATNAELTMNAIAAALTDEHGAERAWEIAFHMADWNRNAAFITALHLYPERFTDTEIRWGIEMFLSHAPSHIRAACQLTDNCQWVDFYGTDKSQGEAS